MEVKPKAAISAHRSLEPLILTTTPGGFRLWTSAPGHRISTLARERDALEAVEFCNSPRLQSEAKQRRAASHIHLNFRFWRTAAYRAHCQSRTTQANESGYRLKRSTKATFENGRWQSSGGRAT